MKDCPKCGEMMTDNDRLCSNCGSSVSIKTSSDTQVQLTHKDCPLCNATMPYSSEFCPGCGVELKKVNYRLIKVDSEIEGRRKERKKQKIIQTILSIIKCVFLDIILLIPSIFLFFVSGIGIYKINKKPPGYSCLIYLLDIIVVFIIVFILFSIFGAT